jgi:NADH-quinone oxidoreductase subunit C
MFEWVYMTFHLYTPDILATAVTAALSDKITRLEVALGEVCISTTPLALLDVLKKVRDTDSLYFKQLMDICGVDYPSRPERFEVVYNLLSVKHNARLRIKVKAGEDILIPSAVGLYPSAGWWEREAWDMYGLKFAGNPDLRRILTDYGFEGHPLRKDFPVIGHVEVRYDPERQAVVYEPVQMAQEYRAFDYLSPWEGAKYILPGDEKAAGGAKP